MHADAPIASSSSSITAGCRSIARAISSIWRRKVPRWPRIWPVLSQKPSWDRKNVVNTGIEPGSTTK
jgi:hypothetical protein